MGFIGFIHKNRVWLVPLALAVAAAGFAGLLGEGPIAMVLVFIAGVIVSVGGGGLFISRRRGADDRTTHLARPS